MSRLDFLFVGTSKSVQARCEDVARSFGYTFKVVPTIEEFAEKEEDFSQTTFICVDTTHVTNEADVPGFVQVLKQIASESYVLVVVDSKMRPETTTFVKRSGASLVLLETEFVSTSKLEFVSTQKIKASYLPIKVNELMVGTALDCHLFHLLPLNKKFIPILHAKQPIEETRLKKLSEVGEVFIRREDLRAFAKYSSQYAEQDSLSVGRMARANFLSLVAAYTDLALLLTDQSEHASYDQGKKLYEQCQVLAQDLLGALSSHGNPWEIVNNTAVGDFGSVERAPAVASYAGLLSLYSKEGNPNEVMIAALMADIGMLDMEPAILKQIRSSRSPQFTEEERSAYEKHPIMSLNRVLGRKLPIPENMKQIVLCTHEQIDQKGFPNRLRAEKIPSESMLIGLAEEIDRRSSVRMGEQRPQIAAVKKEILDEEYQKQKRFSLVLLEKLRPHLS